MNGFTCLNPVSPQEAPVVLKMPETFVLSTPGLLQIQAVGSCSQHQYKRRMSYDNWFTIPIPYFMCHLSQYSCPLLGKQ